MKQFTYTVKNPFGMHVRPSGALAKQAQEYPDTLITVACGPETVTANSSIKLMSLGIKKGDVITLTFDGEYEQDAYEIFMGLVPEVL